MTAGYDVPASEEDPWPCPALAVTAPFGDPREANVSCGGPLVSHRPYKQHQCMLRMPRHDAAVNSNSRAWVEFRGTVVRVSVLAVFQQCYRHVSGLITRAGCRGVPAECDERVGTMPNAMCRDWIWVGSVQMYGVPS